MGLHVCENKVTKVLNSVLNFMPVLRETPHSLYFFHTSSHIILSSKSFIFILPIVMRILLKMAAIGSTMGIPENGAHT